ncbi:MAG TPA: VWA domain-containing protein [Terriglobales bacterium]|nr:VWA domain-containing protein [Terriglobales bacterium]
MIRVVGKLIWLLLLLSVMAAAQDDLPDAPSATRPQPPLTPTPMPRPNTPPPESAPPPSSPSPSGREVPREQASRDDTSAREQMFTLVKRVDFVTVPVTVKDRSGRLVSGLLKRDFKVYEEGVEQELKLFTSDPFPLSAAVVLDLGMPEVVMRKVRDTLPALAAAFSEFDEVAFYTFDKSVEKTLDFSAVTDRFYASLKRMKPRGRSGGVPVVGGPLGQPGPTVSGKPLDPGAPHVYTPAREPKVLNDAILQAALDLSERDRTRRKVIFVISDGREYDSQAGYSDVLKVLLSNEIAVYAVGVDQAAIPVVRKLATLNVPGTGHGNLLPKYASATGGEVFAEFNRQAIESAYSKLTVDARNQYTLGYTARATPANQYRTIEVVVLRPDLEVRAKDGYYPLPVSRTR